MVHQLQKALDLEETDNDTLHQLIFLLMHFLSQPQQAGANEDKGSVKVMNFVLRYLSVLMGCSPVFNAFLSNLPQVFDHNFNMGKLLLPTCLPVLQFCPSPHRSGDLRSPNFSLWCLQQHPRKWWLTSVLTIMYKFDYTHQPLSSHITSLIKIILMTLENHFHRCRKVIDTNIAANLAYSREQSQGSIGAQEASGDQGIEGTPPTISKCRIFRNSFGSTNDFRNSGDVEKPLSAIPESPKLESQEGICELIPHEGPHLKACLEGEDQKVVASSSAVIPQSLTVVATPRGVTSVMASQIQAFHDSFTVKVIVPYQGKESLKTCEEETPSKYIFRPIGAQDRSNSLHEEISPVRLCASEAKESLVSSTAVVKLEKAKVQEARIVTSHSPQGQIDRQLKTSSVETRVVEPRITRIQSIDSGNQQGRHFSPQSPLSMMDLITLGSPIEVDVSAALPSPSPSMDNTSPKALELPTPERLLHVGVDQGSEEGIEEHDQGSVLEKNIIKYFIIEPNYEL
ncbi:Uncoordinated protein 79 [Armadillidium nasatum]|uniref:Uncoordinated protein 79 n=1 Tax=Armadillidium nasatum TaxID=96803 RepID=A0A5N5SNS0_9CRUS|nr:Uncoordinated protein 79 [Armadillidium nasatum]